jgi:hypothetical protein
VPESRGGEGKGGGVEVGEVGVGRMGGSEVGRMGVRVVSVWGKVEVVMTGTL